MTGLLDTPREIRGECIPALDDITPDYDLLAMVDYRYKPEDSYFCKVTKGCIRKCSFCAVPRLEPCFGYRRRLADEVREVASLYGEKQHLVLLDNNILAIDRLDEVFGEIRDLGFGAGAKRNGRKRTVDFNQGIDCRLISEKIAKQLASLALDPVRLAFDTDKEEEPYRAAIHMLAEQGFNKFTNYVLFNYNDNPQSLYRRLRINIELCNKLGIRISAFPMRYVPVDDVDRHFVSRGWRWKWLRGIQCILLVTKGIVSPNPAFFYRAFGHSFEQFLEIVSMPESYIIHREEHENDGTAAEWRRLYKQLSPSGRMELMDVLELIHFARNRTSVIRANWRFRDILWHYYPQQVSEIGKAL